MVYTNNFWLMEFPDAVDDIIFITSSLQLTSLGDLFYQCWHYQSEGPLSPPPSRGQPNSPSLHLGYSLWLKEASQQQQVGTWPHFMFLCSSFVLGQCLINHPGVCSTGIESL